MLRYSLVTLFLFIALTLTACAPEEYPSRPAINGVVTYRERIALPPDAVVEVKLIDASLMDVAAKVLETQIIPTEGAQVPIPWEIQYTEAEIIDNHTYQVRARITDGQGALMFTNTTAIPVITRDAPVSDIEIWVEKVN